MFFCPFRPVEFLQILMDAGEKVRKIPLGRAGRVQHILDALSHQPAVDLVREGFLRPFDDGAFCSGSRFCSAAGTAVVRLWLRVSVAQYLSCTSSGETTFMSHSYPRLGSRCSRSQGAFSQIHGNFHLRCFFGYEKKHNKFS